MSLLWWCHLNYSTVKNILVPTDFSDNAWDALTYAIRLYDDITCCFYILNTYEVNPSGATGSMYQFKQQKIYDILKEESEKELNVISNFLNDNMLNDKHEYKTISKSGSLVQVVRNFITKKDIDVIIMGTTGVSGLKGVFMGSNAVKIIKKIEYCPIICVPEKYVYEELEQVMFANDFKKHLSKQDLTCLIELQLIHNFSIRFIHIEKEKGLSEVQQYNIGSLKTYFENDLISFEGIESDSSVSNAITVFAEKEKINMVCLANYEHSFIEKLTHEPVIKRVGFRSPVPLLVLPV